MDVSNIPSFKGFGASFNRWMPETELKAMNANLDEFNKKYPTETCSSCFKLRPFSENVYSISDPGDYESEEEDDDCDYGLPPRRKKRPIQKY